MQKPTRSDMYSRRYKKRRRRLNGGKFFRFLLVVILLVLAVVAVVYLFGGKGAEPVPGPSTSIPAATPGLTPPVISASVSPSALAEPSVSPSALKTPEATPSSVAAATPTPGPTVKPGKANLGTETVPEGKKYAYLTFDDGPSPITPKVLEILREKNVKATWFVIGYMVEERPQMLKQIEADGHVIGNHGYSHVYKTIYASADAFGSDIQKGQKVIEEALGHDMSPLVFRFPGGSMRKNPEPFVNKLNELGYNYYDWNVLSGDGEVNKPTVEYLKERFLETLGEGKKKALVLMHDTYNKDALIEVLPFIIDTLREDGYEFRTLY